MKSTTAHLDPRFEYGVRAQEIDARLMDELEETSRRVRRLVFLSKFAELITEHATSRNGYDQSEGDFALRLLIEYEARDDLDEIIEAVDPMLRDTSTMRAWIVALMDVVDDAVRMHS